MLSDEQLIADLKEFADDLGETPTSKQMNEDGPWSDTSYQNHFGSWNQAIKEAGLEPVRQYPDSEQKLLEDLQRFAEKIGETPRREQMMEDGPWSDTSYQNYFGSWNQALKEARLEPVRQYPDSEQKLLEDLQRFAEEIGETPTLKQINDKGPWSKSTYKRYFGSWNQALKEAGLEPVKQHSDSKQKLLEDLQRFSEEIGEVPTQGQMEDKGPWSKSTYNRHFGNWNRALEEAGFEPIQEYPVEPEWSDDVDDYYGESWTEMREKTVQRDNDQCRVCGDDELIHVHHIKPRRCFEDPDKSNILDNLITLCASCHGRFENRWTDTDPDEFEAKARELLSVA